MVLLSSGDDAQIREVTVVFLDGVSMNKGCGKWTVIVILSLFLDRGRYAYGVCQSTVGDDVSTCKKGVAMYSGCISRFFYVGVVRRGRYVYRVLK